MQRIYEATGIKFSFDTHTPPHLLAYVEGKVVTSGWTNPELFAWRYITAPEDGVQNFDFTAEEPSGITLQVISPISTSFHVPIDIENYWGAGKPLKGIRVHAQLGSVSADIEKDNIDTLSDDRFVPWPMSVLKPGSLDGAISSLKGHEARVYHQGDMITFALRPQRVNIELIKGGNIIQRIWFG